MKISGDTLYDLLRYAYKNNIFDDEQANEEISKCFLNMRDNGSRIRCTKKVKYEIKLCEFGKITV